MSMVAQMLRTISGQPAPLPKPKSKPKRPSVIRNQSRAESIAALQSALRELGKPSQVSDIAKVMRRSHHNTRALMKRLPWLVRVVGYTEGRNGRPAALWDLVGDDDVVR